MIVWVVMYNDPEGCSEIEAVFSSEELAIVYMKKMGWRFYSAHKFEVYTGD